LRVGAVDGRFERTDGVVLDFGAYEAADLDAGLRAWNVIKAVAVKAADFHILHRLGFDRQLRCPRADRGDEPGDEAKQKTFRLHVSPRNIELHLAFDASVGPSP